MVISEKIFIKEYIFEGYGNCKSTCSVLILKGSKRNVVVFIQNETDKGTSVTNACEMIATSIRKQFELDNRVTEYFETYLYNWDVKKAYKDKPTKEISRIFMHYNQYEDSYESPLWRVLSDTSDIHKTIVKHIKNDE